jgi:D-sedoheptulose 7-phosphate isomerase
MSHRAVFIDRDGVILHALVEDGVARPPRCEEEFAYLPGVGEALALIRAAGLLPVVVTNQPDVARGLTSRRLVAAFHDRLRRDHGLSHVYACFHDDHHGCDCRKPAPGLLRRAAAELDLDLGRSFMVGDRWRDIEAGRRAGCMTLLVRHPYSGDAVPDVSVSSLLEAARHITRLLTHREGTLDFTTRYLNDVAQIAGRIDRGAVEALVDLLVDLRTNRGRLFLLGVGGSAGNASHAVNDFRKICDIETYAPTDNVSEITARINDEGWDTVFAQWLRGSRLGPRDVVGVFSVGGGDVERGVSVNLVRALEYAKSVGARIFGIVGRTGGFAAKVADACVIVPTVNADTLTAHAEAFQAVVWHLLVVHPRLQTVPTRWESLKP